MDDRLFLRGLVSYVGFKQTSVLYDRDPELLDLAITTSSQDL